jgi:hypothetical protein
MTDNPAVSAQSATSQSTKGAVVRLFGVILIILGALNTMLSWRGGFEILSLPVFLIAAGCLLCLISVVLRGDGS